ncbi:MAG: HXXEE domain-containing protein [Xanthobacteraceae bacterium]|nr:HXXEE domain-containing protein [Xanthobacteraceae bacterium]
MPTLIADSWQKALPVLAVIGIALWLALFRSDPASEQAMFAALLVIYMLHQIEEHLWPGGFRQFTNARVFESGRGDWPVDPGGVALVNIGYVWLPVAAAALFPHALRWLGLAWVALTLINAVIHVVTSIRFRCYNPGLVTSVVLFLPFTIWVLAHEVSRGLLTGGEVALLALLGVVLHIPVAALFVVPYLRKRAATA